MKNKQLVIVASVVVGVLAASGGYALWHAHTHAKKEVGSAFTSTPAAYTTQTAQPTTEQGTQAGQSTQQITTGGQITTPVNTQTSSGQNTAGSDMSGAQKLLDPTTFAQYDKYKSGTSASYIDLQAGTGTTLTSGHTAAVYYKGWLTNGTLFDQSQKGSDGNLQAFTFTVGKGQVIPGWEQGLVGMKAGGVRLLIVPPAVGYGAGGQGPIPGNSVLIFQVQLVAVQ